jgi:hypothetical protein
VSEVEVVLPVVEVLAELDDAVVVLVGVKLDAVEDEETLPLVDGGLDELDEVRLELVEDVNKEAEELEDADEVLEDVDEALEGVDEELEDMNEPLLEELDVEFDNVEVEETVLLLREVEAELELKVVVALTEEGVDVTLTDDEDELAVAAPELDELSA